MLTDSQNATLHFLRSYIGKRGRVPTLAEIAKGTGISSRGVVHRRLAALAEAGLIEHTPRRRRGIRLIPQAAADRPGVMPLMGRVAAGKPIEAVPDVEELDLGSLLGGPGRYALKVRGDSMVDAGILAGDYVVVKFQEQARNGQIVAALIDGTETTIKKLRRERDGRITLIPANSHMKPLIYTPSRVRIQGVVVGQLRTYK